MRKKRGKLEIKEELKSNVEKGEMFKYSLNFTKRMKMEE